MNSPRHNIQHIDKFFMVSLQVLRSNVINIHKKLPVSLNDYFTDSIKFLAQKISLFILQCVIQTSQTKVA